MFIISPLDKCLKSGIGIVHAVWLNFKAHRRNVSSNSELIRCWKVQLYCSYSVGMKLPRVIYPRRLSMSGIIVIIMICSTLYWLPYYPLRGATYTDPASAVLKKWALREDGSLDSSFIHKPGHIADMPRANEAKHHPTTPLAGISMARAPTTAPPIDPTKTIYQLFSKVQYRIGNFDKCKPGKDIHTLIYIHTSPGNVKRREALRKTWLDMKIYKSDNMRAIFVMGLPNSLDEQKEIIEENHLYNDIVQGDFQDQYHNLSIKSVMALHWVATYCPKVRYVIKADDDAFYNIFHYLTRFANKTLTRTIICNVWGGTMPILRTAKGDCMKWCVDDAYFPGETTYPTYCSGLAYTMTSDIIREMYLSSYETPYFWVDDVYTTGMLTRNITKLNFIDIPNTLNFTEATISLSQPPSQFLAVHNGDHHQEVYSLWNVSLRHLQRDAVKLLREDLHLAP